MQSYLMDRHNLHSTVKSIINYNESYKVPLVVSYTRESLFCSTHT